MKDQVQIPSAKEYIKAIRDDCLTSTQLKALQVLYSFPAHSATAGQVATVLGYTRFSGANSVIGNASKALAKAMSVKAPQANKKNPNWWSIVADADCSGRYFVWIMRPQLIWALETLGLAASSGVGVVVLPDEEIEDKNYEEGHRIRREVNIYERSREARQKCFAHYGCNCVVCGFDFQGFYGSIGSGFTHVHHIIPLSQVSKSYIVNPVRDLRPVCPNCHAMIHKRNPAFTIEEMRDIIKERPT